MFKPSDLAHFFGSEQLFFNPIFRGINYTDGVKFIGDNGASWLVTDVMAVLPKLLQKEEFLSIKCKVNAEKRSAKVTIDDGNDKVLYTQDYPITDLPCDIHMYCEQSYPKPVLMLTSER